MTDLQRLRVAWLCWGIPALVGVACTVFFVLTHHLLLMMIGLVLLPVGIVLSVVGGWMLRDSDSGPRALIAILLLSNYPLACFCAWTGLHAASPSGGRYRLEVLVRNDNGSPIDSAVVTYGKYIGELRNIPPLATARIKLNVGYLSDQTDVRLAVHRGENSVRKTLCTLDGDDFLGSGFNELSMVSKERKIEWAK